jgi:hypothetical protein
VSKLADEVMDIVKEHLYQKNPKRAEGLIPLKQFKKRKDNYHGTTGIGK